MLPRGGNAMNEFGRRCSDCGTVTIFDGRSTYQRRCARCGRALAVRARRLVCDVTDGELASTSEQTSLDADDDLPRADRC